MKNPKNWIVGAVIILFVWAFLSGGGCEDELMCENAKLKRIIRNQETRLILMNAQIEEMEWKVFLNSVILASVTSSGDPK